MGLLGDEKDFITDQVEGDTKIVLFHGTVDRCETDLGYRLPSDVKITKFDGYDMGLLGDIHKRQHLEQRRNNILLWFVGSTESW